MERITKRNIEAVCDLINRETGAPVAPWLKENGKLVGQIGNYHISHAYGGVALHRMCNTGGGVVDVFSCGHVTKRDLYERMHAFRAGLREASHGAH